MNHEKDTYEDEEIEDDEVVDDTFPDEEADVVEEREEERSYDPDEPYRDRWVEFLDDPWPRIVGILTIIGFAIVLLTPPALWAIWLYQIVGNYVLIIMAAVGSWFSITIWKAPNTSRLRWGGVTNLVVILLCAVTGTVDSIVLMITGYGLLPAVESPLLMVCATIVIFCLYALWIIQRSMQGATAENPTP